MRIVQDQESAWINKEACALCRVFSRIQPCLLQVGEIRLAVVAERERINREAGPGGKQFNSVATKLRVGYQVIHPGLAYFDVRMPFSIEPNVDTLVLRGKIFSVLPDVNTR